MAQKKHSQEFEEKQEILKLQDHYDQEKHKRWMEGLMFQRESDKLHHEREMERQRIKTAEIKKMQERKANHQFMREYGGKC